MDYGMIGKIEKAKRYAEERYAHSFQFLPRHLRRRKQPAQRRVWQRRLEV